MRRGNALRLEELGHHLLSLLVSLPVAAGTTVGLFFSFLLASCNVIIQYFMNFKSSFHTLSDDHCVNFLTIKNTIHIYLYSTFDSTYFKAALQKMQVYYNLVESPESQF